MKKEIFIPCFFKDLRIELIELEEEVRLKQIELDKINNNVSRRECCLSLIYYTKKYMYDDHFIEPKKLKFKTEMSPLLEGSRLNYFTNTVVFLGGNDKLTIRDVYRQSQIMGTKNKKEMFMEFREEILFSNLKLLKKVLVLATSNTTKINKNTLELINKLGQVDNENVFGGHINQFISNLTSDELVLTTINSMKNKIKKKKIEKLIQKPDKIFNPKYFPSKEDLISLPISKDKFNESNLEKRGRGFNFLVYNSRNKHKHFPQIIYDMNNINWILIFIPLTDYCVYSNFDEKKQSHQWNKRN
eukprot:TRINITY_DN1655_c1_g1_i1.p1 TRINITY_DN1655_c1_g1~~TRINITY_DN1655_c1_g1_i1.p1  ORF type:complete len:301 (-),score=63.61 TRINITY_DN1655_c1_g1_i1:267-1169(-)